MPDRTIRRLAQSAVSAALICAATALVRLPAPNGYVHAGDAILLPCALLLGPWWGAAAAAVGAALADLLAGYALYVPATCCIKAVMAILAAILHKKLGRVLPSAACAQAVTLPGYLLYELALFGRGAWLSLPANFLQAVFSTAAGSALCLALRRQLRD